jgi:hypothetical protein
MVGLLNRFWYCTYVSVFHFYDLWNVQKILICGIFSSQFILHVSEGSKIIFPINRCLHFVLVSVSVLAALLYMMADPHVCPAIVACVYTHDCACISDIPRRVFIPTCQIP